MNTITSTDMALRRLFLLSVKCCALLCLPFAVPGQQLHRYDPAIEAFTANRQVDSTLFYIEKACQLAVKADSMAYWADCHYKALSLLRDTKASWSQLLAHLEKAGQQKWRAPRTLHEAIAYHAFLYFKSWVYQKSSQLIAANVVYAEMEALAQHFGAENFNQFMFNAYKPWGNNFTRLGDNEKALVIFEKALKIATSNEDKASLYNNIALAHNNSNAFEKAIKTCNQGLALTETSAFMRGQLTGTLARIYTEEAKTRGNDLEKARQALQNAEKSLSLYQKALKDPHFSAKTLDKIPGAHLCAGEAALLTGANAQSFRSLQTALTQQRSLNPPAPPRDLAKFELALGNWFLQNKTFDQCLAQANRVLAILLPAFKPSAVKDNPDPKYFFQENSIFEALQAKAAAAEGLYRHTQNPEWLYLALSCHDLAWQAEMILREALQYQSSKLGLQEDIRLRDEAALRVARQLYELTGDQQYAERGLRIAERSKAHLLLDALRDNLIRQQLSPNDPVFNQIHALRENMALLEQNSALDEGQKRLDMDVLRSQARALELQIASNYPRLATGSLMEKLADIQSVLRVLMPQELALLYFTEGNYLHCFVVSEGGVQDWQKRPMPEEIPAFLSFFKHPNAIGNAPGEYLSIAEKLGASLLPERARHAAKLCIIPDGLLCFVPFEALLTGMGSGVSLRNAPYLIRQAELRYAFSLTTLARQSEIRTRARSGLLAYAPLFMEGQRGLAPLNNSATEWNDFGFLNSKARVGAMATANAFLSEALTYKILHLSTHVSAGDQPRIEFYDRALFLPEVYAMPLNAELVVLSACETGLGVEQKGEGVMSLARAFAQAGAPGIISSLWSVNDRSTASLFQVFYRQLRGGQTMSASLRSAKLAYMDNSALSASVQTPYYWAGFVAVGDSREVSVFPWWQVLGVGIALVAFLYYLWRKRRIK